MSKTNKPKTNSETAVRLDSDPEPSMKLQNPVKTPLVRNYMSGGMSSDDCPEFDIIPPVALRAYADRLVYGGDKRRAKGFESFDARCPRPQYETFVADDQFVIDRLNHVIHHALKAIEVIRGHALPRTSPGGDGGAIMFGGGLFAEWEAKRR